jgi:hypothetical protein
LQHRFHSDRADGIPAADAIAKITNPQAAAFEAAPIVAPLS